MMQQRRRAGEHELLLVKVSANCFYLNVYICRSISAVIELQNRTIKYKHTIVNICIQKCKWKHIESKKYYKKIYTAYIHIYTRTYIYVYAFKTAF